MSRLLRSTVAAGLVAGLTLVLYAFHLGPPPPLSADEQTVLQEARRIVTTGRDAAGRPVPVFFQVAGEQWIQPVGVYVTGAIVAAGGDSRVRLGGVLAASLGAALTFLVALRVLGHPVIALVTAATLALSPGLFLFARTATDSVYVVPIALVWLLAVVAYLERPRPWRLAAAGLALGVGVLSHPGGPITMGLLTILTVVAVRAGGGGTLRPALCLCRGLAVPALVAGAWFLTYPDSYQDTMGRWAVHQAHVRSPLDGVRSFVNWTTLGQRASLYWGFFDPSWLFFQQPDRTGVLRGAPPLLWPLAFLIPAGAVHAWHHLPRAQAVLLVGGLLAAPVAASTLGEPHNLGQAMVFVVFASLCAGLAVRRALVVGGVLRPVVLALAALGLVQFVYFLRDASSP